LTINIALPERVNNIEQLEREKYIMINEQHLKVFFSKFGKKLEALDTNFYNDVVSTRDYDEEGDPRGSGLIMEIAQLSSFFVDSSLKKSIGLEDASYAAFLGWKFSDELIHRDNKITLRYLNKASKKAKKYYKSIGAKVSINSVAWQVFCCAMLREEFYQDFNYEMKAFMYDSDEEKVRVAFTKH